MFTRQPIVNRITRTFGYSETQNFTTGAVSLVGTQQVWRLNSLFDPNFTGVGHQPYGYDQFNTLYSNYKVHKVKVKMTWFDVAGPNIMAVMRAGGSYDGAAGVQGKTADVVAETPGGVVRNLTETGKQAVVIEQEFSIPAILGMSQQEFEGSNGFDKSPASVVGANPFLSAYLYIGISDNAVDAGGRAATCRTEITFYAQLWGRLTQVQS